MDNYESSGKFPTEEILMNKKYSRSSHGKQCLGPCVTKNKKIIHPITLETVTDKNDAFCPVAGFESVNEKNNKKEIKYTDTCYGVQVNNINKNESIMNVLVPYLDFDTKHFLIMFYNINNYEEGITWINTNSGYPITTRERIFESILNVYGETLDIIDNRTTDFILLLIKYKYDDIIYERLKRYIYIDLLSGSVKLKENKQTDNDEQKQIKLEYIYKKYINSLEINKFLYKYLRERKKNWLDIKNYIINIINDLITYSIRSINISIEK